MKISIYISTLVLILMLFSGSLFAQSEDSYDRDIRIAEGIIAELFEAEDSRHPVRSRHVREVTGRYIPGYGIHFNIEANLTPATVRVVLQGHAEIHIDEDSEPEEIHEVGREFIEERFMEYLKNYASLFNDLPDNEVIRLTIGPHNYGAATFIVRSAPSHSHRSGVNITAWATASDIRAYDTSSISEEEFESRIEVLNLSGQETERDQTVFASILQTSLDEISDQIRVHRTPATEYLPGLGLNYSINASLRSGGLFNFDDIQINEFRIEMDSVLIDFSKVMEDIDFNNLSNYAGRMDSLYNTRDAEVMSDSLMRSLRDLRRHANQRQDSISREELREMIDQFHDELIRTVRDYGATLRSLENDEMLMITIHWSGRHSDLPQRTELRIRKSDIINGSAPDIKEYSRR